MSFAVDATPAADATRVEPRGELDLATVPRLRSAVDELLHRGCAHLVLDLRGLAFLDVAGLRLLLGLQARAAADGWRLSLVQGPPQVRRLFELTGTLAALPFAPPSVTSRPCPPPRPPATSSTSASTG